MSIFNYKLYIFDLDGTIIDSEYSHYEAYNRQLIDKITFNEYERIFHDEFSKIKFINDNAICKKKKEEDFIDIYANNYKFIDGFELFFNELIELGKDIYIVTNSSEERVSYILKKHPLLNRVSKIITSKDMKKIKPDPECYINAINNSNTNDIIIFEDSYIGYKSLESIDVEKVFICKTSYYYYNEMKSTKYDNYISISNTFERNNIDYIVICASGKGTRLMPITKHIPKLLVNVNNNCILHNIISYWKDYSKKFVVVIDSEYNKIVQFYLELIQSKINITYEIINVVCSNGEENSYTINRALVDSKYIDKKVLITWCDIFPKSIIPNNLFTTKNIIFTYKDYGRYDAYDNVIEKKHKGNIIGIYYFSKFKNLTQFEPRNDICDCYTTNFGDFITYEIKELVDIGDYKKLFGYLYVDNSYKTRYFNNISNVSENYLLKESTCEYGNIIINKEMDFYKYHDNKLTILPKISNFYVNSFVINKIIGKNAIDVFNSKKIEEQTEYLAYIFNKLDLIHSHCNYEVDEKTLIDDIDIEFNSKILNRIKNIKLLLDNFKFIKSVNGIKIRYDHNYIINNLYVKIKRFYETRKNNYYTIHGDPHLSNIINDVSNNLFFIDPRGYFGKTKLFGLKEYDYSKILYSISGFDEINANENHYFIIDNDNISVNITNNITSRHLKFFDSYNKEVLIDMVVLHWFGLTDYSKNNLHKCISAYYYGIYLYHLYNSNEYLC
jgi:HAD superfamily hydrolase (TIGR01509 family)